MPLRVGKAVLKIGVCELVVVVVPDLLCFDEIVLVEIV